MNYECGPATTASNQHLFQRDHLMGVLRVGLAVTSNLQGTPDSFSVILLHKFGHLEHFFQHFR